MVLEGKYWKRRLATVTAEYKKWRIFYKNQIMGRTSNDLNDLVIELFHFCSESLKIDGRSILLDS